MPPLRHDLQPLLPNEPRILNHSFQESLTAKFLLPRLAELEALLLTVRLGLDAELQRTQPIKLGKPYPLGQCLEIAEAVAKRLRAVKESDVRTTEATEGLRAFKAFKKAGGAFRQVWGDLRGEFFQNAFQLGTLYVDVANDTVTPTKPKVEILPFNLARFIPIRDYEHYARLARAYWGHEVYPNHVFPSFAPHFPLLHIGHHGEVQFQDPSQYMLAMTRSQEFAPSESTLRAPPMPLALFKHVRAELRSAGFPTADTPTSGREQALRECRIQRSHRWHTSQEVLVSAISELDKVNNHFHRKSQVPAIKNHRVNTYKLDGIELDLNQLSPEAKAQLQNIQFVDQELARLRAKMAAMQTARNAYIAALNAALNTK